MDRGRHGESTGIGASRWRLSGPSDEDDHGEEAHAMTDLTGVSMGLEDNGTSAERTTLLDLIWRLGAEAESDAAVVAAAESLLQNGRVRLTGNFRDVPVEQILSTGA
jgi:hypothetical protein